MKDKILNKLANYVAIDKNFNTSDPFTSLNGWDSLKHVQFILEIESDLGIRMTPEQLVSCTSIDKICEIFSK